jgi:hypothetical protein
VKEIRQVLTLLLEGGFVMPIIPTSIDRYGSVVFRSSTGHMSQGHKALTALAGMPLHRKVGAKRLRSLAVDHQPPYVS